jgi:hypothetical protein
MIKRTVLLIGVLAVSLATTGAMAARNNLLEYGYFAPDGTLNGTITYTCDMGQIVEGELIGTKHLIYSEPCSCSYIYDCTP